MKISNQKARKPYTCARGCEIKPGDQYYKYQHRYASVSRRCINHYPKPSELTTSDKLGRILGAQEDLEAAIDSGDLDAITEALEAASSEATEVGDEYDESADNMDEYFPDSPQVEEIREKADACRAWGDELETAKDEIELEDPDNDGSHNLKDRIQQAQDALDSLEM